jgi:hypothetical protein
MHSAQANNLIFYYRYKLNENSDTDSKMISKIEVSKKWTIFPNEIKEFKQFIRTKDRPTGILDYEQFNRYTEGIHKSSIVEYSTRFPMYTRDTLASMPRKQLVEICNAYNISTVNRRPDFLINQILIKQEVFRIEDERIQEELKIKKLEEIAENKVNEILDLRKEGVTIEEKEALKNKVFKTIKKAYEKI